VGGIDLTIRRRDSCRHGALDPLRKDPDRLYYQPYHDTQLGLVGPAALQLAWLFRERWRQLTQEKLQPVDAGAQTVPLKIEARDAIACFRHAPVNISITDPGFRKTEATLEIAQLYRYLLGTAEKYVFIETQYLTSHHLVEVLCEVLSRPTSPDIFIILPERLGPWLERKTLTHLQALALTEIIHHDHRGKLRILYPFDPELLPTYKYVTVHSKLMVVDDRFLTLGSANLNNRSMGLPWVDAQWLDMHQPTTLELALEHWGQRLEAVHVAALCLLQMMPIAPHMLVNAAAGAAGVPILRFLMLTLIGMIPGCVILALFQRTVIRMCIEPSWSSA
jgi:phosphatidylserine/phosphatidylglycerophosphate/cardiolipin synthase-like enzyme